MFDTPDDLLSAAWQAMSRGVADRRHPARSPTLATVGPDGPEARTVVLRGWSDGAADLHTDSASAKVADLRADPRAALHVWIPKQSLQIRLRGTVEIATADADCWARVPDAARAVYGGTPHPGTPLDRPEDHRPGPTPERFAVLRVRVRSADLLHLGADLHRRATVSRQDDGWRARWIAP